MTTPSYKTNDPRGWCGDPKRGAALGRPSLHAEEAEDVTEKLYLRRVHIDSGGYDCNGTYFGLGAPLYWCASQDGSIDYMLRADDREHAKQQVREKYPHARFWR